MKCISSIVVLFFCSTTLFAADSTSVVSDETIVDELDSSAITTENKKSPDSSLHETSSEIKNTDSENISAGSSDNPDTSIPLDSKQHSENNSSIASSDTTKTIPIDSTAEKSIQTSEEINSAETIIDESEEDLILDGGEESIILPAVTEKPAVDSSVTLSDSGKTQEAASVDTDSSNASSPDTNKLKTPLLPISPIPEIADKNDSTSQLKIEQMKSINFAKNLKNYRSPKIAILLSLLFPGAGQAYAKSYLKGGLFGAVEIALITAGSILGVKGSNQLKDAHKYGDDHYSVESFEAYYDNMHDNLSKEDIAEIFLDENEVDTFYSDAKKKNQSYYNYIGFAISPYIHGWDDVTPEFDSNFEPVNNSDDTTYFADPQYRYLISSISNGDTTNLNYGHSENQKTYNKKVSKANDSYRWSKNFFTILIINHIASAIDAAITAKSYNDKLLGKTSFLDNINIREKIVSTPTECANGLALEVRF